MRLYLPLVAFSRGMRYHCGVKEMISMDRYITGGAIKRLREGRGLTQAQLAERLNVSDRTVSKWETGRGYPDITLLSPLAAALGVSLAELFAGSEVRNRNLSSNMLRSGFYVCPVCGNVLHSMGEAVVSCHGIALPRLEAEEADGQHAARVEKIEDEYFVSLDHEMTREHHIAFMALVSDDRMSLVKLYPEGNAEARFKRCPRAVLYFCCNRDGLFRMKL